MPVFREMPGDLLTPVSAFRAVCARVAARVPARERGGRRAARALLVPRPRSRVHAGGARRRRARARGRGHAARGAATCLPTLRARLGRTRGGGARPAALHRRRRRLPRPTTRSGSSSGSPTATAATAQPLASFSFYRSLVAFDHVRQRLVLIADVGARPPRRLRARRRTVLDALEADLRAPAPPARRRGRAAAAAAAAAPRRRRRPTCDAVRAGQGVHRAPATSSRSCSRGSAPWPARADPFAVYRALRMVNPSPYMYFLKDGDTRGRGRLAGDAGAGRGRPRGDAAHRRARGRAGADRGGGRAARAGAAAPTRRSAPST